jgi:hypothetical protein
VGRRNLSQADGLRREVIEIHQPHGCGDITFDGTSSSCQTTATADARAEPPKPGPSEIFWSGFTTDPCRSPRPPVRPSGFDNWVIGGGAVRQRDAKDSAIGRPGGNGGLPKYIDDTYKYVMLVP